ncbi:MAG: hypothetical protein M1826_002539 [Phylliscum demangeonii]|nr:MAG: hypothetical protein M1826_002539 [Phylliscum demangeonii]
MAMADSSAVQTRHVVLPTSEHTHTVVLLHGRGSNGPEFAEELFEARTSSDKSLPEHFPSWKWVFPTSRERYSSVFQENMTEWFDICSLSDPSRREDLQVEGLKQSLESLLELIEDEAKLTTPGRLVLGGISQGCATSVHALFASSCKLGAYLGFCGWMPFKAQVQDIVQEESALQTMLRLARFYQVTLGLKRPAPSMDSVETVFETPVFLSHALDDAVVEIGLGKDLRTTLEKLRMSVVWKEYQVGGHWIKEPDGFDDMVAFLKSVDTQQIEPDTDSSAGPRDDVKRAAYKFANQTVINALSQQLKRDPSMDLSGLLGQLVRSYEIKQKSFLDGYREGPEADILTPMISSGASHTKVDIRKQLEATSVTRIVRPLTEPMRGLLGVDVGTTLALRVPTTLPESSIRQLNRLLIQSSVIWELGRLAVLRLHPAVVVKVGPGIDVEHLSTVEHIKRHARTMLIPDTLGVLATDRLTYIFMSPMDGEPLDRWWPRLTREDKLDVQSQLNTIFVALRSIPRPLDEDGRPTLGGGTPRRCKDMRREVRRAKGPIVNEKDFNAFIVSNDETAATGAKGEAATTRTTTTWREIISSFLRSDHDIVMTHGDLHPRNVMVEMVKIDDDQDDDGYDSGGSCGDKDSSTTHINIATAKGRRLKVTGLVDWESSGWYPSYWEYVKALHTISNHDGTLDWWTYLPTAAIGLWGPDYAVDRMISRWLG